MGAVAVRICSSLFTSGKEMPVLLEDPRRLTVSVCVKWCACSFVLLMDPTRAHMMSLRFLSAGCRPPTIFPPCVVMLFVVPIGRGQLRQACTKSPWGLLLPSAFVELANMVCTWR